MADPQQTTSGEWTAINAMAQAVAERDRYREALERIAAYEPPVDDDGIVLVSLQPLKVIAVDALGAMDGCA